MNTNELKMGTVISVGIVLTIELSNYNSSMSTTEISSKERVENFVRYGYKCTVTDYLVCFFCTTEIKT